MVPAAPFERVYAAIFIDAPVVKVCGGQVANRPVYAAIGVTVQGRKDVLGLWMGTGGGGAKYSMSVLMSLRNRGVQDTMFARVRWPQRPPGGGGECVAAGDRANVCYCTGCATAFACRRGSSRIRSPRT